MEKFANRSGWSDTDPYEIIKVNTPRKLTIREMTAELDPNWKREFVPGGFCGHTINNGGEWIIESNPGGYVTTIRLHKNGVWKDPHGNRYWLSEKPVKYYDFNF